MRLDQKRVGLIYGVVIALCFMPFASPAIFLLVGIAFSILGIKHNTIPKYSSFALKASIVLMGFGMNLPLVISVSQSSFIGTAISVSFVMLTGLLIGRMLKIDSKVSLLVSSGTAICGGSAIAAVAPVINAKSHQISFSLVVIFVLNAIALLVFPMVGHYFNIGEEAFGYWAAIAIHDTSSVVGAGATYGTKALEVATTVKLVRTLWIIPLSIAIALFQSEKTNGKIKVPWFIALFIASIVIAYLIPQWQGVFDQLNWLGKKGMVVALFLIGTSISIAEAKNVGVKSFILGISLWIIISVTSFIVLTV